MDFRNVKSLTIPEGVVKKITSGGVVLWTAKGDGPTDEPIWTWNLDESTSDKTIKLPDGFDITKGFVKLTLSAILRPNSAGYGWVRYYDENLKEHRMSFQENEKFSVTAYMRYGSDVMIVDSSTNGPGFTFYYDYGLEGYIQTKASLQKYEPTQVTLWAVEFIPLEPATLPLIMIVDDLVAAGELTADGRPLGSDITLSNGITLYPKDMCRTAANYNYQNINNDKKYSAAIRIVNAVGGGILLDITNYNTLTLIGRSTSANSPRNFRVGGPNATPADSTTYTNYTDMLFHDPNAGSVSNAVTLAQYDLTTIKNTYGSVIKLWFSGNADVCELRLE